MWLYALEACAARTAHVTAVAINPFQSSAIDDSLAGDYDFPVQHMHLRAAYHCDDLNVIGSPSSQTRLKEVSFDLNKSMLGEM